MVVDDAGPFGDGHSSFPICTSRVHDNYSWKSRPVQNSSVCRGVPCFVASKDGESICRVDGSGEQAPDKEQERVKYTYIDESYLSMLQKDCHWNRDNGIIELMPIAVVVQQQQNGC